MKTYYIKKTGTFSVIFLADALFLYSLLLLSWLIRGMLIHTGLIGAADVIQLHHLNRYYLPLIGFSLFVFISQSLYFSRNSYFNEYKKIIKSALVLILFWGFFVFTLKLSAVYSRVISLLFFLLILVFFPFYRRFIKSLLYRLKIWQKEVLIIGDCFPQSLRSIVNDKVLGYRAKYFPAQNVMEVKKILDQHTPEVPTDLLLVFQETRIRDMEEMIQRIEFNFESIKIFGSFSRFMQYIFLVETSLPYNFFVVKRNLLKPYNRVVKRLFDLAVSILVTLVFLPLLIVIIIVLLICNRGKIFYVQERLGYRGKKFKLLKFRTMYEHSDQILSEHLRKYPQRKAEWETYKKFKHADPRVTGIGRIMRKCSLDELPQILNIFKGEMSLIGPRPYLKNEMRYKGTSKEILTYGKPGLTGLWQIMGRNELDFESRILIDEYYIRNWDFWLDLFILMRTPFSMIKGY